MGGCALLIHITKDYVTCCHTHALNGLVFVVEDKDTATIIAQWSIPGYDAAVYAEGKGYITSYQTYEAGIRVP